MVDVVIDGDALNGPESMGSSVHPSSVVGLHLECIDEGVHDAVLLEIVGIARVPVLANHGHDLTLHLIRIGDESSGPLDISQDLGFVGLIGDPSDLGALHGVPESDAEEVIAPGLAVVGEVLVEGPLPDLFDADLGHSEEGPELVVGLMGFCGNGGSSADELIMF